MLTDWFIQHPRAASTFWTLVFCVVIAIGLTTVFDGFIGNLIVSICIGASILGGSFVSQALLGQHMNPALLQAITMPVGLLVGLVLGGWTLAGNPTYFFSSVGRSGVGLGVLFGCIGTLGFLGMHIMADMRRELDLRRLQGAEQARQLVKAQLNVLQAQMEPHFLFNTLSNVISLIEVDPARARTLLEQLTQLLRASLRRSRRSVVTVADELEVVTAYLRIQQLRMAQRLQFQIDCPDELLGTPLPPLMLQPLVENAVRHGIEPAERGGNVRVQISRLDDDSLQLSVTDNGVGVQAAGNGHSGSESAVADSQLTTERTHADATAPDGVRAACGQSNAAPPDGGTSLPNMRDRLHTLYGSAASVRLYANTPCGTVAELRLPAVRLD